MRTRSRAGAAASLVAVAALALAPAASFQGTIARAASPTTIELTSDGTGVVGSVVTITVVLYDSTGAVFDGKGTLTRVRFYFAEGSPNDLSAGNGADLVCSTETVGWCQVSYVAAVGGTDTVCAVVTGPAARCLESSATGSPVGYVDIDVDLDEAEPQPTPGPVQAPTPTPGSTSPVGQTPTPPSAATPTPPSAATPTPTSKPKPTATPRPSPSAAPAPSTTRRPTSAPDARDSTVVGSADSTGGDAPTDGTAPPPTTGIKHEAADEPPTVVGVIIEDVAARLGAAVKPAAVAAVASTFTFPLSLMVVVLLFLLVQSRLDGRDPKLRTTSVKPEDTTVAFVEESDL